MIFLNLSTLLIITTMMECSRATNPINIQLTSNHSHPDFINIIKELNEKLNAKWNAVIALNNHHYMEKVIKSVQSLPVILVTEQSETQFYSLHNHQFLTIVFVEVSTINNLYKLVRHQLINLQFTQIFWIMPEAGHEDLLKMAKRNWFDGYVNCLYYTRKGVFTYNPVPVMSIQRIWQLQNYYERKQIIDFKKHPLTIPVVQEAPRCYYFTNRHGNLIKIGYLYKTIEIFVKHFNFDLKEFPTINGTFNVDAFREGLSEGIIDFIPTLSFSNDFSRTDVVYNTKVYLLAPYPQPISNIKFLLHPYDLATKLCLVVLLIFCACAFSFIFYRVGRSREIDLGKSVLHVLAVFISQNHIHFNYITYLQKLVYILLFLNGFIVTNLYLAKLSSMYVTDIYEPKLRNFNDLNKTEYKVLMRKVDFDYLFNDPTVRDVVLTKAKFVDHKDFSDAQHDLNGTYILSALEDKMRFYMFQQRYLKTPLVYVIDEVLAVKPFYFSVRQGLPYQQLFNRYLAHLMESGIHSKLLLDANFDGIYSRETHFLKDEQKPEDLLLDFHSFYCPFGLFIFGMVLSLIAFAGELICFRFSRIN